MDETWLSAGTRMKLAARQIQRSGHPYIFLGVCTAIGNR